MEEVIKRKSIKVDTKNGILNETVLNRQIKKFAKEVNTSNYNYTVTYSQKYPKNNISEVVLTLKLFKDE